MLIIVASANIFRRELTSYILGEAGFHVSEARDAATLLATLMTSAPGAAIVDAQLPGDGPAATLLAVRQRSSLPLLWIAEPEQALALIKADAQPCDHLSWPYHPETLLAHLGALLARVEGGPLQGAPRARYAGSHQ